MQRIHTFIHMCDLAAPGHTCFWTASEARILDLKESVVAAWRRGPRVWRLDRPDPRADGDRTATFFSARGPFPAENEHFDLTKASSPPSGDTTGKSCGRHAFRAVCVRVRVSVCAHVRPYARAGARVCAWMVGAHACEFVDGWVGRCFAVTGKGSLPRARCCVCVRVVVLANPCAVVRRRARTGARRGGGVRVRVVGGRTLCVVTLSIRRALY